MRLGWDVESLDADTGAQRVVEQAAMTHRQMLRRRLGLARKALKRAGLFQMPLEKGSIGEEKNMHTYKNAVT
jgi:hypothetical protein